MSHGFESLLGQSLTIYTNRQSSPRNAQLGRTCSRKVPGVAILDKKMAATSSLKIIATSGKRGSVIWSKLPSHSWLPAELMLLVCCNCMNFIFVTSIKSRAAVQTGVRTGDVKLETAGMKTIQQCECPRFSSSLVNQFEFPFDHCQTAVHLVDFDTQDIHDAETQNSFYLTGEQTIDTPNIFCN